MPKGRKGLQRLDYYAVGIIVIILIGTLVYKSSVASFTYDESSTYNHGVRTPIESILTFRYASSNNHVLNTILMKFSEIIFGNNELALRLPNLIAFALYMYYSILLIKQIEPKLLLPFLVIMVSNPFVLDFFALARGYGLSLAFTVMSSYFIVRYFNDHDLLFLKRSLSFAVLGVLSNFSFLYFYLSLLVVISVEYLLSRNCPAKEIIKPVVIASGIIAILIAYPLVQLISTNQLYHGGEVSFWNDTVTTLVIFTLYHANYDFVSVDSLKTVLLFVSGFLILLVVILQFIKYKQSGKTIRLLSYSLFMLLLIFTGTTLSHYIFDVKYLIGRTAIYLVPVFLLAILAFIAITFQKSRFIGYALAYALSTILAYHTIQNFQTKSYFLWKYDMNTEKMLADLKSEVMQNNDNHEIALSVSWLYNSTITYYRDVKELGFITNVRRNGVVKTEEFLDSDYFYLEEADIELLNNTNYRVVQNYGETNTYLVQKLD